MSSWLFLVAHNIACLQQAGNTYYFKTNHVWSGTLLSIVLYILHTLSQKYSEFQDKTRACQGTIRCNCWPAILFVNKSQTYVCTCTVHYTLYSILLHPLQPRQDRFLCDDSDYFAEDWSPQGHCVIL